MSRRRWLQMLVVAALAVGMLVITRALPAQGKSEEAFEHVKEVQERHTEKLMAKEGVVGTAVGHNDHGRQAVMVLLERPGVGGIPQTLEGVPVHPVITGQIYALATPTSRFPRPVPTGVSTGHPAITIPCGQTGERLPVGAQLVGRLHDTPGLLDVAEALEPCL